jgi:hypothetical protein
MLKSGILRFKVFYLIPAFFLLSSTAKTIGQDIVYLEIQNDFLNYKGHGTDKYFTGGISCGGMIDLKNNKIHYLTIALTQKIYTPSNIRLFPEELSPLDYPYAGLTYLSMGYLVFNEASTSYTKGTLSWGNTGPSSGANLIQRVLHKIIGDRKPMGWSSQLQLGNFVQTHIEHTHSFLNANWLKVNTNAAMEIGSIFNNFCLAMEFKIDHNKDSFIEFFSKRINTYTKPHISIWAKPKLEFVIGNRLLQSNPNPSGITPRNINKFIYHSSVGISFQIKKFSISLIQHHNTPEFKTAMPHAFGEIAIQLNL